MRRWLVVFLTTGLGLLFSVLLTLYLDRSDLRGSKAFAAMPAMTIIDLGTLGGPSSYALDVNESGFVAGESTISPTLQVSAFRWDGSKMLRLGAPGYVGSFAYAINESDVIAGAVISEDGELQTQKPGFWLSDSLTVLPGAADATASDINDAGVIVGHTLLNEQNSLLIWQGNTLSQSIPIADGFAQVHAVNNSLQMAGQIHDGAGNSAFLWEQGQFEDLGTLGGQDSIAYDLNNVGQVVGASAVIENLATHAFVWQDGQMRDLGELGLAFESNSRALGVNDNGQIVGEAEIGGELRAVLWSGDKLVDLNNYLPPNSQWGVLQTASSISDNGLVVGTGLIDGEAHAFLLQPEPGGQRVYLPVISVPEPEPTPTPVPTPEPSPTPPTTGYDLRRFMTGDGRIYEVLLKIPDGSQFQARHQTQFQGFHFYHTKGNNVSAEWEELWSDNYYMYRGTDTSPGNGLYYTLYESRDQYLAGNPGSRWTYRYMWPGDLYFRQPYVVFFRKSDCGLVIGGQYTDRSWLEFLAFHRSYTFESGITLNNVVELAWLPGDENGPTQAVDERYFYAEDYGLVGWKKPSLGWHSDIVEEFVPGERPDNKREFIPCLNQAQYLPETVSDKLLDGPLPDPYASMVRP